MIVTDGNIIIRTGLPEDSSDFANLILLSEPTLFPAILGFGARNIIQNLFREPKNLLSFQHSYFIEKDSATAGMIIGYDGKTERAEGLRTGQLFIKYMKLEFFGRITSLLKAWRTFGGIENDEYYISNVTVYPEFRGTKLGTALLLKAEEEVKRCGAKKSILDVDIGNQGAIRLYKQLGYSTIGKPKKTRMNQKEFVFLRMRKECQ